LRWHNEKRFRA